MNIHIDEVPANVDQDHVVYVRKSNPLTAYGSLDVVYKYFPECRNNEQEFEQFTVMKFGEWKQFVEDEAKPEGR